MVSEPSTLPSEDDGVDVSLIRWLLGLSPEERLAALQGFVDSVCELTPVAASRAAPAAQVP